MSTVNFQLPISSLDDTTKLANVIGSQSWPGIVIALDGDLGAGKTTFSKSLAAAIGVKDVVSSPTFTIIKEYKGDKLPFYHMDVYRLSLEEADELGLDDYFYGDGVTVVEWATLIEELMPEEYLAIGIEYVDEQRRMVHIQAFGERYRSLLQYIQDWSLSR